MPDYFYLIVSRQSILNILCLSKVELINKKDQMDAQIQDDDCV